MTARRPLPVGAVWLLLSLAGWGIFAAVGLIVWAVTR